LGECCDCWVVDDVGAFLDLMVFEAGAVDSNVYPSKRLSSIKINDGYHSNGHGFCCNRSLTEVMIARRL